MTVWQGYFEDTECSEVALFAMHGLFRYDEYVGKDNDCCMIDIYLYNAFSVVFGELVYVVRDALDWKNRGSFYCMSLSSLCFSNLLETTLSRH